MQNDDPIYFSSADEFRAREHYHASLYCAKTDLAAIVGKYLFNKTDEIPCGLNGCNQPHQHGLVIRLIDGRETHCGRTCGREFFGVSWDAIEARFQKAEASKHRRDLLQSIVSAKHELLTSAVEVRAAVEQAAAKTVALVTGLERAPPLLTAFRACVKNGGRVQVAATLDSYTRETRKSDSGGQDLVTVATIDGVEIVSSAPSAIRDFDRLIVSFLQGATEELIAQLGDKELERLAVQFNDVRRDMANAHNFLRAAERFHAPANVAKLWTIRLLMNRRFVTARTDRVLRAVTQCAPPSDSAAA